MKISQLPQEVKEKALEYQEKGGGEYMFDKKSDDLNNAFEWLGTKDGLKYWLYWHDKEFKDTVK